MLKFSQLGRLTGSILSNLGGDKKPAVKKRNKNSKKEEAPQILDETYQRLDSYSKSVKSLYHAVSFALLCSEATCLLYTS